MSAVTFLALQRPDDDVDPLSWQGQGLCAETDPEAFFPEKGGSTRAGKQVCTGCPVRTECLQYALDNDERFGIWGGLNERDRRRLRSAGSPTPALTLVPDLEPVLTEAGQALLAELVDRGYTQEYARRRAARR